MSDTICVQERLPAGASGVLINQTHTYKDLIMPIDATEKRMVDAIDGKRSIGDIAKGTGPSTRKGSSLDLARAFFERLWWYDQVVFDGSHEISDQSSVIGDQYGCDTEMGRHGGGEKGRQRS
jgi:hypothetical protein